MKYPSKGFLIYKPEFYAVNHYFLIIITKNQEEAERKYAEKLDSVFPNDIDPDSGKGFNITDYERGDLDLMVEPITNLDGHAPCVVEIQNAENYEAEPWSDFVLLDETTDELIFFTSRDHREKYENALEASIRMMKGN